MKALHSISHYPIRSQTNTQIMNTTEEKANVIEVLLVEDNPLEAKPTIRALAMADRLYHVVDGAEALDFVYARGKYTDRVNKAFPKIILLDLKLPKINGLEVVKC